MLPLPSSPGVADGGRMPRPSTVRIAYLLSQYPAINHTYLLREVKELRKLGLEIRVASISRPGRPLALLTSEEIDEATRTFYVKAAGPWPLLAAHVAALLSYPRGYLTGLFSPIWMGRGNLRKTLFLFFYFVEAVVVGRWMMRNNLSHVHSHYASTVGLIAARVFPITVSFTFHGPAEFDDPAGFYLSEKLLKAKFVCAISKYGRSQLMRACPHEQWDKIELTPLGVDPYVFPPRPFRENTSPFRLVCVGRLCGEKAQHVLIAAMHRLVREGSEVQVRLVGDGPDRSSLEQHAAASGVSRHVIFEGWLDQGRLCAIYEQTDALVLPSFAEGLPVVLMEAMAMEIPCVATRIAGIPELIRDGVDGLLVPPSDDAALAAAIARLMGDSVLRRRLGAAARQAVLKEYDLGKNAVRLADAFGRRLPAQPAARPS
jgi:colanic acid/amylovoran biosynthesis glycosyltransferase